MNGISMVGTPKLTFGVVGSAQAQTMKGQLTEALQNAGFRAPQVRTGTSGKSVYILPNPASVSPAEVAEVVRTKLAGSAFKEQPVESDNERVQANFSNGITRITVYKRNDLAFPARA